jgi:AAA15 family ATPase/GTPase
VPINRVEIKDFLVFKGEFNADFCPGVNIIIGGNGTGKTTLMKVMYAICDKSIRGFTREAASDEHHGASNSFDSYFQVKNYKGMVAGDLYGETRTPPQDRKCLIVYNGSEFSFRYPTIEELKTRFSMTEQEIENSKFMWSYHGVFPSETAGVNAPYIRSIYIPTDDMLSHSPGLLALDRERQIPFDKTQMDILAKTQYPETREIKPNAAKLLDKIKSVIGGDVIYENESFYISKEGLGKIQFTLEASGYRKFGLLWKLLRNGLLESGVVLFWDEPENSLNPELVPVLVEILLELSRGGVQIFLATHSELLASYFTVNRQKDDEVKFYSLYKDGQQIKYDASDRFDLLNPNKLMDEPVKLYEKRLDKVLGDE